MKHYTVHLILTAAVCAGAGAVYHHFKADAQPPPEERTAPPPAPKPQNPDRPTGKIVRYPPAAAAEPAEPKPEAITKPAAPAAPAAGPTPLLDAEQRRQAALRRYWEQQARRFDQMVERLNQADLPEERDRLIRSMAGHVRINTLQALQWAMDLTDPAEKRAALEAINEKALSGIGARIEVDATGFPKIRETTVLSAVAATGQVAPGDYIIGMEDGTGQSIYFEGLPAQQVARHLRGEPGTELRLQMERVAPDGSEAYSYEVTIQRSLLVIQPPF
jgi:C-terminal processing protease CtpA/Prc